MRRKLFFLIFILFSLILAANPWGNLKKIYFYKSLNNKQEMIKYLNRMEKRSINTIEADKLGIRLIELGDYFYLKGDKDTAIKFYNKSLDISDNFWFVYNKINYIKSKGKILTFNFKHIFKQFLLIFKDFDSSFLFINSLIKSTFFSAMFVFFVFIIYLFITKFKLVGNDLMDEKETLKIKRFIIIIFLMIWPVIILSGWSVYPFLISAILFSYLNTTEKRAVTIFLIITIFVSIFLSFNLVIEKNYKTEKFLIIKNVVDGKLYPPSIYEKFDNELKLYQAYAYFQAKEYTKSFDIVQSIDKNYKSKLKYDLLGSLYYKLEEFQKSIDNFEKSLKINENDETILNNFTIVLLKEEDSELVKQYEARFPQVKRLKNRSLYFKNIDFSKSILWRRLLSNSEEKLNLVNFFKEVGFTTIKLPYLYLLLLFLVYQLIINRFLYELGESTYCSKCSKVIKKHKIHRSYDLCEECYQLFLIKDVVFLEAKLLKEDELKKKHKFKFSIHMFISLFVPGFVFNYSKRSFTFVISSLIFWFFAFGFIFLSVVFNKVFGFSPLITNVFMFLSFLIYMILNFISIKGEDYGI